jgi:carbon-monoxide dehydrogenase iron sulfur subunit
MIDCNIRLCVGCRMCEVACSVFHFGSVSPVLSRIRVAKLEEIGLDLAVACVSCAERPCLDCPKEALSAGAGGEILLDSPLCDACQVCVDACPIGAVGFFGDRPLICDLCGGETRCVAVCPTQALSCMEGARDISLKAFQDFAGSPGEKRARYVRALGEPLRASWQEGARVDS